MYDKVITVDVSNSKSDIHAWRAYARELRIEAFGESQEAAEKKLRDDVERAYPGERVLLHIECVSENF